MTAIQIEIPDKLVPLFQGSARYRISHGGRGSAKTRTFAKMSAVWAYKMAEAGIHGQILCAREHLNSLDESSMAEVKAAIRSEPWLNAYFDIGEKYIRTKNGRVSYTFAGLRTNVDSVKSKARILLCWVDEAEGVLDSSWRTLIPTVREEGFAEGEKWISEIWVTFNPKSDRSATYKRFVASPPRESKVVVMNFRDNPWFPSVLNDERLDDKEKRPDTYGHIWEGDFLKVLEGAYWAKNLKKAEADGRMTRIPIEPVLPVFTFWDLGINNKTGNMAVILMQPIGKELRFVGSYLNADYGMPHYVNWLLKFQKKHEIQFGGHYAPHDIAVRELISGKSRQDAAAALGIQFEKVDQVSYKQISIDAANEILPRCFFDPVRCEDLLESLWNYHRLFDEKKQRFLGQPDHDWSSDYADAFQQFAMVWTDDMATTKPPQPLRLNSLGGGWMG